MKRNRLHRPKNLGQDYLQVGDFSSLSFDFAVSRLCSEPGVRWSLHRLYSVPYGLMPCNLLVLSVVKSSQECPFHAFHPRKSPSNTVTAY